MSRFIFVFTLIFISAVVFLNLPKRQYLSPSSPLNQIESELNTYLKESYTNLSIDIYNHKISFQLIDENHSSNITLSTNKNLYMQISALQKILKTVRINQTYLKTLDLSSNKPYATIKNN